jgi:hypothetical protein
MLNLSWADFQTLVQTLSAASTGAMTVAESINFPTALTILIR